MSITLLGPTDKAVAHNEDEDDLENEGGREGGGQALGGQHGLLLPPAMKRELVFLRIGIHRASHLPALDSPTFGMGKRKLGSAIDAYVKIRFQGYKAKTRVVQSQNPEWYVEFWIPVLIPSIGAVAIVEVRDQDTGPQDDDYVDVFPISLDAVLKKEAPELAWHHMYGLNDEADCIGHKGMHSAFYSMLQGKHELRKEIEHNLSRTAVLQTPTSHGPAQSLPPSLPASLPPPIPLPLCLPASPWAQPERIEYRTSSRTPLSGAARSSITLPNSYLFPTCS